MIKGAGAKQVAPEYKMDLGVAVTLGDLEGLQFPGIDPVLNGRTR